MRACVCVCASITSSTAETVFRQSIIFDWKLDVPGEDKSSFARTTKSEILIRSGMFPAKWIRQSVTTRVCPSFTRATNSHLKTSLLRCARERPWKQGVYSSVRRSLNSSLSGESCPDSDPSPSRFSFAALMCARGGAPAERAIVRPWREGANSIITWECLRSLARCRGRKECARVSSRLFSFLSLISMQTPERSALRSPWICRMPHSQTKVKERNFNGWRGCSEKGRQTSSSESC